MLKSLFSGVSGLQSHQIAMDVESNNIANVNTIGFKYSRANFSDLLAQTNQIATAPQGQLGGKNAVQIGLGASVASVTRIHTQGSIQNTDKNTDLAIQGDGFFIVSSDNGSTYKYTRSGDFKFDGNGNFVDNNGFIAQGRLRDPATGKIEPTSAITNLVISPGLTTPANATSEIVVKANLNAGPVVQNFSKAYAVPSGVPALPESPALDSNGVPIASGDFNILTNESGQAFNMQDGQGVWIGFQASTVTSGAVLGGADTMSLDFTLDDGTVHNVTATQTDALATADDNVALFVDAINAQKAITGVTASIAAGPTITLTNDNSDSNASHNINFVASAAGDPSGFSDVAGDVTNTDMDAYKYLYSSTTTRLDAYGDNQVIVPPAVVAPGIQGDLVKQFSTLAELREAMERQVALDQLGFDAVTGLPPLPGANGATQIIVNDKGELEVSNAQKGGVSTSAINLKVTAFTDANTTENIFFTNSMESINTILPADSTAKSTSQAFNAPSHATSIDIFDSLGVKWTLRVEFRKTELTDANGSTWSMRIIVPEPAEISDSTPNTAPGNDLYGSISFDEFGAISSQPNPSSINFIGHNGSDPTQTIDLNFGTLGQFDGMTSFDSVSSTSGINQDGFTGGDLLGIRIDQSGTLIGSFSNGRSFGLAQMTMAKFANNEGLLADGGNIYLQSSNSGEPILGTAASAGRGFIQSAALEASNVDLSRSLTQLIIIQRGYQANGKTITTSDTLLETLIGLKR
jgi:flagellar hook protein FlgE